MKRLFLLFAVCSACASFGQSNEFKIYPNGLIYSDTTMKQLGFIVDSLNLKFKRCELQQPYYSKCQATAHFISLEKGDIRKAKSDIENNISFEDFIKKYPSSEIDKDLLVIKFKYWDSYAKKDKVEFSSILVSRELTIEDNPKLYDQLLNGKWVYDYNPKDKYSDEYLNAFFFTSEFLSEPLPEEYARMVQYSDCMIDTSAQIFRDNASRDRYYSPAKMPSEIKKLFEFINKATGRPDESGITSDKYWQEYSKWREARFTILDEHSKKPQFQQLLQAAANTAMEKGGSSDELEEYIERYYSKKIALELKRNRIVVGSCSMDDSPRLHAMSIALLSAETVNWETFLRAHLDIMNDRFERASDGSYAWGRRNTYIRELEELDIDVSDLILGIVFRIENPGKNHYFGSIGRIGRALSETKNAELIESRILQMIGDDRLDDYNRILMYWLFLNYNHYIQDEARKKKNVQLLKTAIMKLPDHLSSRLEDDD